MTEVPIIETSPLICRANQCVGFYMIGTSVMKKLKSTNSYVEEANTEHALISQSDDEDEFVNIDWG